MRFPALAVSGFVLLASVLPGAGVAMAAPPALAVPAAETVVTPNETIVSSSLYRASKGMVCPGGCVLVFPAIAAKRRAEISQISCIGTFTTSEQPVVSFNIVSGSTIVATGAIDVTINRNTSFNYVTANAPEFLPILAGEHLNMLLIASKASTFSCVLAGHLIALP